VADNERATVGVGLHQPAVGAELEGEGASTSGLLLGVGIAMLFATPMSGLGVLAAGAGVSAFLLLWFRRSRVVPPSR
jgi:hypothetical protein